ALLQAGVDTDYLKAWRPPGIASRGHRYCLRGPVTLDAGATGSRRACGHSIILAVCSLMLWLPVSTQMVLCTMRSMIASACTPEPSRWCQSFFAYCVQNTVEAVS